jgi:hypothetical protein
MKTGIVKLVPVTELPTEREKFVVKENDTLWVVEGYKHKDNPDLLWAKKEDCLNYNTYDKGSLFKLEMLFNGQYNPINPEDYSFIVEEGCVGWRTPFNNKVIGENFYSCVVRVDTIHLKEKRVKENFTRSEVIALFDKLAGDLEFNYKTIEAPSIAVTKWCQENGL